MSDPFYPYGRQSIDAGDVDHVAQTLRSDFLTTGPAVQAFEKKLADYTGASFVTAVSSGTGALHAAYFAAGLQPGQEIITSPLTFASTANAALFLGASVKFVDINPQTGCIDPDQIEAQITDRTRLIVPVDYAGAPADYDRINAIAEKHHLKVVADGAHSLGATYHGRRVGTLAHATITSFHPVKPVTTAEGGCVFTDDSQCHGAATAFRTHGIRRDPETHPPDEGPWYYQMHDLGYNYRLSDVHASLGVSQMDKLDRFIARRRAIADRYHQAFPHHPELTLPSVPTGVESGWHLYVVRVNDPKQRRAFFEKLRALQIGVQVHYIPVYYHPYYQRLGYRRGLCPAAEDFYSRCVSLPIYPAMGDDDVECVIDRVQQAIRETL